LEGLVYSREGPGGVLRV